jgi:hypothetical protein
MNRKYYTHTLDILTGFKEAFNKMVMNANCAENDVFNLQTTTTSNYHKYPISKTYPRYVAGNQTQFVLESIQEQLDTFIRIYRDEAGIIFGDVEDTELSPLLVINTSTDTVTNPKTIINGLLNYVEKLIKEYGPALEYSFIIPCIEEFKDFLETTIYEIESIGLFTPPIYD